MAPKWSYVGATVMVAMLLGTCTVKCVVLWWKASLGARPFGSTRADPRSAFVDGARFTVTVYALVTETFCAVTTKVTVVLPPSGTVCVGEAAPERIVTPPSRIEAR